ncbi:hypothetical protein BDM02DRAFT_3123498 [Thelephora ganbajun]|uniref:Uncharacterized protein n=1 Tax=Thelephora ganbajun TaxID=370292 RepID=A0ACB6Z0Y8_THEGA|nr:hypothetical protein BDM02DRAFT_3123498 [Thelephora ganbajun]
MARVSSPGTSRREQPEVAVTPTYSHAPSETELIILISLWHRRFTRLLYSTEHLEGAATRLRSRCIDFWGLHECNRGHSGKFRPVGTSRSVSPVRSLNVSPNHTLSSLQVAHRVPVSGLTRGMSGSSRSSDSEAPVGTFRLSTISLSFLVQLKGTLSRVFSVVSTVIRSPK